MRREPIRLNCLRDGCDVPRPEENSIFAIQRIPVEHDWRLCSRCPSRSREYAPTVKAEAADRTILPLRRSPRTQ